MSMGLFTDRILFVFPENLGQSMPGRTSLVIHRDFVIGPKILRYPGYIPVGECGCSLSYFLGVDSGARSEYIYNDNGKFFVCLK